TIGFLSNRGLFFSAICSMLIILGLAIIPPLANMFFLVEMSLTHWILAFILSMFPLLFVEIQKLIQRKRAKA
ncbi:cation transporting ATPase C-terminal domain-containing protein, partial [Listeria monocytogenes]|nr:cation transporting ATPase C-terminal domain-containing protein [Listeria monocytogenes]